MMRLLASGLVGLAACAASESADLTTASPAEPADIMYIGNAGVLVAYGETKILFDPLYQETYGQYQAAPSELRTRIFEDTSPLDSIDAIFISHAHGDHFSAPDLVKFHDAHPDALIIAPQQALDALLVTGAVNPDMADRFVTIDLGYGDDPARLPFADILVEAVRVPHAGGAARRAIQNIVYRVTIEDTATLIHMGDADPAAEHFTPYADHWAAERADMAFPPYWFFFSDEGTAIVDETLNTRVAIGVHVPVDIPSQLDASGRAYFASPGEVRQAQVE